MCFMITSMACQTKIMLYLYNIYIALFACYFRDYSETYDVMFNFMYEQLQLQNR